MYINDGEGYYEKLNPYQTNESKGGLDDRGTLLELCRTMIRTSSSGLRSRRFRFLPGDESNEGSSASSSSTSSRTAVSVKCLADVLIDYCDSAERPEKSPVYTILSTMIMQKSASDLLAYFDIIVSLAGFLVMGEEAEPDRFNKTDKAIIRDINSTIWQSLVGEGDENNFSLLLDTLLASNVMSRETFNCILGNENAYDAVILLAKKGLMTEQRLSYILVSNNCEVLLQFLSYMDRRRILDDDHLNSLFNCSDLSLLCRIIEIVGQESDYYDVQLLSQAIVHYDKVLELVTEGVIASEPSVDALWEIIVPYSSFLASTVTVSGDAYFLNHHPQFGLSTDFAGVNEEECPNIMDCSCFPDYDNPGLEDNNGYLDDHELRPAYYSR